MKMVIEETNTNCFRKTGLLNEEAELLSTNTAEYEPQVQLASVKEASISVEEYLSADEISLTYRCSKEGPSQEVYERVPALEHKKMMTSKLINRASC